MCFAVIARKAPSDTKRALISAKFQGQPDGAGFAYQRKGTLVWAKDTSEEMYKRALGVLFSEKPGWRVVHARLASRGAVVRENCHPFMTGHGALVHNGHLGESEYQMLRLSLALAGALMEKDLPDIVFNSTVTTSDTAFAAYLVDLVGPRVLSLLATLMGKLALLPPTGEPIMAGPWVRLEEGVWATDSLYVPRASARRWSSWWSKPPEPMIFTWEEDNEEEEEEEEEE